MKKFTEEVGITGHLTIIKKFTDGTEEVHFDDHNIIVSGMGQGLAYLFNASGSQSILDRLYLFLPYCLSEQCLRLTICTLHHLP